MVALTEASPPPARPTEIVRNFGQVRAPLNVSVTNPHPKASVVSFGQMLSHNWIPSCFGKHTRMQKHDYCTRERCYVQRAVWKQNAQLSMHPSLGPALPNGLSRKLEHVEREEDAQMKKQSGCPAFSMHR